MYKYITPSFSAKPMVENENAAREATRGYIKQRYPSYTSIFRGIGDVIGVETPDVVLNALNRFGGGVAGTINMCGCVTEGLVLLGLILGEEVSAAKIFQNKMPSLVHNQELSSSEKAGAV
ncbi:MAG: hypothetical protein AB1767_00170 [Bacillota bacterium]